MVKAVKVRKGFGALEVLKGVSLEVAPGEVMVLIGPSGGGKSYFPALRQPSREDRRGLPLRRRRACRLQVVGERLHELREHEICAKRAEIGMVFQRFNLFPHLTALENVVEAPVGVKGEPRDVPTKRPAPCWRG